MVYSLAKDLQRDGVMRSPAENRARYSSAVVPSRAKPAAYFSR